MHVSGTWPQSALPGIPDAADGIREILKYLPHRYPFLLVGIDEARFKRQVIPGGRLGFEETRNCLAVVR